MAATASLRARVGFNARTAGPTLLEVLSRSAAAELYVAVDLHPRDRATGAPLLRLVTDAPVLYTEPGDDPANASYRSLILNGWSLSRQLSDQGSYLGKSTFTRAKLQVDGSRGDISDWPDLDWDYAPATVRLGGRLQANGTAYPFSRYYRYFEGFVTGVERASDSVIEVQLAGSKAMLDRQVVDTIYRCFGGGVSIPAAGSVSGPSDAGLDIAGALTIEWFGVVHAYPSTEGSLFRRGSNGYGFRVDAAGYLGFWNAPGSTLSTAYKVPLGVPLVVAASLGADGRTVELFAGADSASLASLGVAVLPTFLAGAGGGPAWGSYQMFANPPTGMALEVWETRLWRVSSTLDDVVSRADAPLASPSDQGDLVECWKFEEGIGALSYPELGASSLTLAGGATWVASYEGDDPEIFPGGPLGQTRPDGWGRARNVRPVNLDSQRHLFQFRRGASPDVAAVYVGGAPAAPAETLTSTSNGQIAFDAATKTITLGAGLDAHRLVPGQDNPPRDGQRLTVTGTGSNNGTLTIADAGVLKGGSAIVVVEAVATESAPAGAAVATFTDDVGYAYDLARSVVATPSAPVADLTADVTLWLSARGTSRVSEVVEELLGAATDRSRLLWDPEVAFWIAPGATVTVKDVIDKITASAFAWWIEAPRGGYRLGTWALPTGSEARVKIGESNILKLSWVPTVTPYSRITVAYDHNNTVQDPGTLTGSVSPARRLYVSQEWRTLPRTGSAAVRKAFPLAAPRTDPFQTYLTNRSDAGTFLDLAAPFYLEKRRWYAGQVSGVSLLTRFDVGDEVWIQYSEPTLGLVDGAYARLHLLNSSSGSDVVDLEVFL